MEITLSDQIELYFDKAGLGNPTFIFIHGGGADTSHLAPQFYFFARRGTAINLDLRGYGKSDKPPHTARLHNMLMTLPICAKS